MSDSLAGKIQDGVHILPVRVYYEDTDFSGVVYYANYLKFFERGRSDFLRLAGIHHTELMDAEKPAAWVVRRIEVDYLKPAKIDDVLHVFTAFEKVKGARFSMRQSICRGSDELVNAKVEAAAIRMDGRPARIAKEMREKLEAYIQ